MTKTGRPSTGRAKKAKSVRVDDGVWDDAHDVARQNGRRFAAVVEELLNGYVGEHRAPSGRRRRR